MALADFLTLVTSMVPAEDPPSAAERLSAIQSAVSRYSQDVPQQLVRDVVWPAAGYIGPLPAEWVPEADLLGAEYPIGDVPPTPLDVSIYIVPPATPKLAAVDSLPLGAAVRLTFAIPHLVSDAPVVSDTVPLQHREAVACFAAHLLCRQLAAYFANERETSINADGSNTDSRARNFAASAKQYRAGYYLGIGKADPQGSGSGSGPAASTGGESSGAVVSWGGRSRNSLTRSVW